MGWESPGGARSGPGTLPRLQRCCESTLAQTTFELDIPNWESWWGKAWQKSQWQSPGDPNCHQEGDG